MTEARDSFDKKSKSTSLVHVTPQDGARLLLVISRNTSDENYVVDT